MQTCEGLNDEPLRRLAGKPGYKLTPQQAAGAEQDDIIHARCNRVNGWHHGWHQNHEACLIYPHLPTFTGIPNKPETLTMFLLYGRIN
jgi:hypothetical protein